MAGQKNEESVSQSFLEFLKQSVRSIKLQGGFARVEQVQRWRDVSYETARREQKRRDEKIVMGGSDVFFLALICSNHRRKNNSLKKQKTVSIRKYCMYECMHVCMYVRMFVSRYV